MKHYYQVGQKFVQLFLYYGMENPNKPFGKPTHFVVVVVVAGV